MDPENKLRTAFDKAFDSAEKFNGPKSEPSKKVKK